MVAKQLKAKVAGRGAHTSHEHILAGVGSAPGAVGRLREMQGGAAVIPAPFQN